MPDLTPNDPHLDAPRDSWIPDRYYLGCSCCLCGRARLAGRPPHFNGTETVARCADGFLYAIVGEHDARRDDMIGRAEGTSRVYRRCAAGEALLVPLDRIGEVALVSFPRGLCRADETTLLPESVRAAWARAGGRTEGRESVGTPTSEGETRPSVAVETTESTDARPACEVCAGCGDEPADGCSNEVAGSFYCDDCVRECPSCSTLYHTDDEVSARRINTRTWRGEDVNLCDSDDCSFVCADCGERWQTCDETDREDSEGRRVCHDCGDSYSTCDECGRTIHNDDSIYREGRDQTYCSRCDPGDDEDDDGLHDYGYRPRPVFHTGKRETAKLGQVPFYGIEVELEVCESRTAKADMVEHVHDSGGGFWYCKHDGSLNDGIEVVSHPATWQHWQERDLSIFSWLAAKGCRSFDTSTCGMHVHISKAALSGLAQTRLVRLFGSDPRFILRASRRKAKDLAAWARVDDSPLAAVVRKVKHLTPPERYSAVNLCPSQTVEVRIFRGTLNVQGIVRNLALVHAAVMFARGGSFADMKVPRFLDWIAGPGASVLGHKAARDLHAWLAPLVSSNATSVSEPITDSGTLLPPGEVHDGRPGAEHMVQAGDGERSYLPLDERGGARMGCSCVSCERRRAEAPVPPVAAPEPDPATFAQREDGIREVRRAVHPDGSATVALANGRVLIFANQSDAIVGMRDLTPDLLDGAPPYGTLRASFDGDGFLTFAPVEGAPMLRDERVRDVADVRLGGSVVWEMPSAFFYLASDLPASDPTSNPNL